MMKSVAKLVMLAFVLAAMLLILDALIGVLQLMMRVCMLLLLSQRRHQFQANFILSHGEFMLIIAVFTL